MGTNDDSTTVSDRRLARDSGQKYVGRALTIVKNCLQCASHACSLMREFTGVGIPVKAREIAA